MILKPASRKILLFLVALFFAGMIGSRFYSFVKPRKVSYSISQKAAAKSGERFTREDPLSKGPFEDTIMIISDGDSVVGKKAGRIRYLGIDTPEKNQPFAKEALEFNKSLVHQKTVEVKPCLSRPWDKYGRRLAFVFVDGIDVSKRLLENGLARVYDDAACNGVQKETLWKTMIEAYNSKKGLWANAPTSPVPAAAAMKIVGKTRKVTGKILKTVKGNTFYFANYSEDWKTTGLALRFPINGKKRLGFDPMALEGKKVTAIGLIEQKKQGPFITIYSPMQVLEEK